MLPVGRVPTMSFGGGGHEANLVGEEAEILTSIQSHTAKQISRWPREREVNAAFTSLASQGAAENTFIMESRHGSWTRW